MLAGSLTEYSAGGWVSHRPEYGNSEKEVASRNLWELDKFGISYDEFFILFTGLARHLW